MNWRPSHVVNVIAVVLERVERPVLFEAPQLDGPVDGGGEEEVSEVNRPEAVVGAQAGHRSSLVAFEVVENTCNKFIRKMVIQLSMTTL